MQKTKKALQFIVIMLLGMQLSGQKNKNISFQFRDTQLDSLITKMMNKYSIAGLSLAVFSDSLLVYTKGYGFRESGTNKKVDNNTVFETASLSKPVFAYAVLRLASKGEIDLDKPLYPHYVDEDIKDDDRAKLITPRIILNHSTGFPNWTRKRKLKMKFTPGSKFSYSGEGFVYLQKAIPEMTGKSVEEILEEEVFEPLNMTKSSFVWKDQFDENFAYGHKKNKSYPRKWKPKRINAAASLHTTATDYAKFLMAVLEGKGLSEEIYHEIFTPQIETKKDGIVWSDGFGLEKVDNSFNLWHWGHNVGFRAYFLVSKESKTGFVYLTNSDKGLKIAKDITDFLTGIQNHPSLKWF